MKGLQFTGPQVSKNIKTPAQAGEKWRKTELPRWATFIECPDG